MLVDLDTFKRVRKGFERHHPHYKYINNGKDGDMDGTFVEDDDLLFVEWMRLCENVDDYFNSFRDNTTGTSTKLTKEDKILVNFMVKYLEFNPKGKRART